MLETMRLRFPVVLLLGFLLLTTPAALTASTFRLRSPVFPPGGAIPRKFTCEGIDAPPPLRWTSPPRGTRSFAILMDDPDASGGTFTLWLGWNIPAKVRSLAAGQHAPVEGRNDERIFYTAPCMVCCGRHHFVFRLLALRAPLKLAPGATRRQFDAALRGKVLATARLVGTVG